MESHKKFEWNWHDLIYFFFKNHFGFPVELFQETGGEEGKDRETSQEEKLPGIHRLVRMTVCLMLT